MVNANTFFLLVLIGSISTIRSAVSISCYQCNSTDINDQFRCTEFMDTYDMDPQPCTSVYNAAYCIKLIGRYEGGLGVTRYCSSHNLGNHCDYVQRPGDVLEYRTCVYTCDSDGCNGSNQVKLFGYLIGIPFLPLLRNLLS